MPFYPTIHPLAFVNSSITQIVCTFSISLSLFKHSFVSIAIGINLYSRSMLHIFLPISFISSTCLRMNIYSIAMGFIIFPLSLICVPVNMCKFPLPSCFSFHPHTLVLGSIGPYLDTISMFQSSFPFSIVLDSSLQFYNSLFFWLLIRIILLICFLLVHSVAYNLPILPNFICKVFTIIPDNHISSIVTISLRIILFRLGLRIL